MTTELSFGDKLKELRAALGITQAELGNRMDVDRVTIARYEANQRRPLPVIKKRADYYLKTG